MPRSADFLINVRGDTRHLDSIRRKIGSIGKEAGQRTAPALAKINSTLEGFAQRNQALFQTIQALGGLSLALRGIVDAGNFVLGIFRRIGELAVNTGRLIKRNLIDPLIELGSQAEASITQIGSLFRTTGEESVRLFDAFRRFARPLPIGTSELVNSAILLQSINLRPTEERLRGLVRGALAFRRPIEEVTSALQSLHSITLRRFGIRLRREGQTARIIFGDMTEEVRNVDQAIAQGILDIFNRRFPNAIEAASRDFDTALAATRSVIQDVFITASRNFLPTLTSIVNQVGEWVKQNEALVQGRLDQFASRVAVQIEGLAGNIDLVIRTLLLGIRLATSFTLTFIRLLNTLTVTLEAVGRTLDFVFLTPIRAAADLLERLNLRSRGANAQGFLAIRQGLGISIPGQLEAQTEEHERLNKETEQYSSNLAAVLNIHKDITSELQAQAQASIDQQIPGRELTEAQQTAIGLLETLTPFTANALRDANAELDTLVGHVREIGQEEQL